MEDDFGVDQSGLRRAQLFGSKTISFQITRALVSEEDVGILQQVVELSAIVLRAIQDGGAHANLHVPCKGLDLGGVGPPDVKQVRPYIARSRPIAPPAITCPIPNARMPSNGFFPSFLKGIGSSSSSSPPRSTASWKGLRVYCGSLRNSSIVRTFFRSTRPSSGCGRLQIVCTPLQMAFSWMRGCPCTVGTGAYPSSIEDRNPGRLRSAHLVSCGRAEVRGTGCLQIRPSREHVRLLSPISLQRSHRTVEAPCERQRGCPVLPRFSPAIGLRRRILRGQADRGHSTKPMRAGNDRVLSVERKSSSAVRDSQSDAAQYVIRKVASRSNSDELAGYLSVDSRSSSEPFP